MKKVLEKRNFKGGGKPRPYDTRNICNDSRRIAIITLIFLALLLSSCGFPGVASTPAQLPTVSVAPTATPIPPIRFPQDEAPHRDLTEWWYYTGHMNAVMPGGQVHHYGFELVFFQALRGDLPPVYAAHFAISDITRGEFHFDQRRLTEPNAVISDGTSTGGIDVQVGDWSINGINGSDHLAAKMENYALHISLEGLKPATLPNGNGLITYGLGGFSYYYSRTRMSVSGTLVDHNQPLQVSGEAWMDHQWGNFITLNGGGWDWFSIQLTNNTEMMLYLIRDSTGKIISSYIGYIGPQSESIQIPGNTLNMTVLDHWRSPVTGATYPSGWRLEITDPRVHVTLILLPELKDQELVVYQSTGNSYWEGAVSIQGQSTGQVVSGEGYVELTGYAH
jgi:predicted secreted hydrolase